MDEMEIFKSLNLRNEALRLAYLPRRMDALRLYSSSYFIPNADSFDVHQSRTKFFITSLPLPQHISIKRGVPYSFYIFFFLLLLWALHHLSTSCYLFFFLDLALTVLYFFCWDYHVCLLTKVEEKLEFLGAK